MSDKTKLPLGSEEIVAGIADAAGLILDTVRKACDKSPGEEGVDRLADLVGTKDDKRTFKYEIECNYDTGILSVLFKINGEPQPKNDDGSQKCTCHVKTLWNYGCECGAVVK